MINKVGRNALCPCGSKRKYKQCCIGKNSLSSVFNKFENGELPFRAEIISSNGQSSSMKVYNASIIKDGVKQILFDDEITLSVNDIKDDVTEKASAMISIPTERSLLPEILTLGNATVSNQTSKYLLEIIDCKKKLKISSKKGLFASILISEQRDAGCFCFDVLFGIEGQKEIFDENNQKNRPHIRFYPSGNGKFIRFSGYKCELINKMKYNSDSKFVYPSTIEIKCLDYAESIFLSFEFIEDAQKVILIKATFEEE